MVSQKNESKTSLTRSLLVLFVYIIITLIMIYAPIGFDIKGKYIGKHEVVFWSNYFWWFDYSTTHLFSNPLHNSHLFYPLGLDMVDCILPLILFIPITHIFGSIVSYNVYVLMTFILAAYGMYMLVNFLLNDKTIAFVSGLIFAFSPFHFGASVSHLHTFSILWIPFFALYFLKMFGKPTYRNIILCSLFFSANALTSWTIAVMISLLIIIFLILNHRFILTAKIFATIKFFIFSVILISPGLYMILKNYISNEHMALPLHDFINFSADILGFVIPSPFHPLFGDFSESIYSNFTGNYSENIVFMGYSVIILSLIALLNYRKDKTFRLFLFSFCVFFILSLGPVLHVNGTMKFTHLGLTVMLPGIATAYLPFFDMIRVPSRYDLMVMFCAAVIAGYGIKSIIIRFNFNVNKRIFFCSLLSLIVLFEFAAVLPDQAVMPVPDTYYEIDIKEGGSIIELPIIRSDLDSPRGVEPMIRYYEYQKIHKGKIFGGYFNRVNPIYSDFAKSDPVLYVLYTGGIDIYSSSLKYSNTDPLGYLKYNYDVRYVILHENLMSSRDFNKLVQYLGNSYTIDNSVDSDRLYIYSTENIIYNVESSYTPLRITLTEGWYGLEEWSGTPTRWIENDATLAIYSDENRTVDLRLKALSFYRPRTLEVYADDFLKLQVDMPNEGFVIVDVTSLSLKEGVNLVRFHSPDGCEKPCDVARTKDCRCLSVAFQDIEIIENYKIDNVESST